MWNGPPPSFLVGAALHLQRRYLRHSLRGLDTSIISATVYNRDIYTESNETHGWRNKIFCPPGHNRRFQVAYNISVTISSSECTRDSSSSSSRRKMSSNLGQTFASPPSLPTSLITIIFLCLVLFVYGSGMAKENGLYTICTIPARNVYCPSHWRVMERCGNPG